MSLTGAFIEGGAGRILVVRHGAEKPNGRGVIVFPAFAEEMNKSRRLVWEMGRVLAARGIQTFVPDLFGTGDSEGEFEDARWKIWLADLCKTAEFAQECGCEKLDALMIRLGATLYQSAQAVVADRFERAVAWQPIESGETLLRQQLRLKVMAVRMAGGKAETIANMLHSLIADAEPMELGGYLVAPELARAINGAAFSMDACPVGSGLSINVGAIPATQEPTRVEPDSRIPLNRTTDSIVPVWRSCAVEGDRFWAAVEPGPNPELIAATADFLSDDS